MRGFVNFLLVRAGFRAGVNLSPSEAGGAAPAERQFADVVVAGRRPKVTALLGQILFAVIAYFALVPAVVRFDAKFLPIVLILLLAAGVRTRFRAFKRPPRATIEGGEFSLRLFPKLILKTPAANIANIDLRAGRMTVAFGALHAVEPVKLRTWLKENFKRHGCHATASRGVFSLEQVNQLRAALRMPMQPADLFEDFEATLQRMTPRVVVTPALIAANAVVFVVMAAMGAGFFLPDAHSMVQWGANYAPLTCHGQWWRLFTSMFLHFGVLHLLLNMYILRDIGPVVERLLGPVGFAIGYLASGFFGGVAGASWHDATPGAGASAAIFGIFGMLLGLATGRQQTIAAAIIKEHRANAVIFLVLTLSLGSAIPGIDLAANLGGFAAGWLCGLALQVRLPMAAGRRAPRNLILAVAASLAGVMAVHFLSTRPLDVVAMSVRTGQVNAAAETAYAAAIQRQKMGEQTAAETGAKIKREILPLYAELAEQFDRVPRRHEKDRDRVQSTMVEYVQLQREAWRLMGEGIQNDDIVSIGFARLRFESAQRLLASQNPAGVNNQVRLMTDADTEFAVFAAYEAQAMQANATLHERAADGNLIGREAASLFERDVLAVWRRGTKRFLAAARGFPVQDQPSVLRTRKYIDLKTAGLLLLAQSLRDGDQTKADAGRKKLDEAGEAAKDIWPKSSEADARDQTK